MGSTEKIAKFIQDFQFDDIPLRGVEQTKISFLDAIGTALLGSKGQSGEILTRYIKLMGGNPQARIIGCGIKTSLELAALANGTFSHADDFDDIGGSGHGGAFLIAPLLALGEWLHLPGKKLIEGYAIGFEIGKRLRLSLGDLAGAGFHSSALLGSISAAAESAKLLELNLTQTRVALGIAASLASGIMQNFGTHTKPFHAGHVSRNGIAAAMLAKEDFRANLEVLEGIKGFVYVYGQEQAAISRLTEQLGRNLAIAEEGVFVKAWPCCGGTHEALTAMMSLIQKYDIKPDGVELIEVAVSWQTLGPLMCREVTVPLEGKFNMPYVMASALVDRKVDVSTFEGEAFSRPEIQLLMKKVHYFQHEDRRDKPLRLQSETRFVMLTVKMKDGHVFSEYLEAKGRRRLRGKEVQAKYQKNAEIGGLSEEQIERSLELLDKLESLPDVTLLMDALETSV